MAQVDGDRVVQESPGFSGGPDHRGGVPCAARPSTSFRHYDGRCECFFGGPPPEYPPALPAPRWELVGPGTLLAS